jgi:hypothetical protein
MKLSMNLYRHFYLCRLALWGLALSTSASQAFAALGQAPSASVATTLPQAQTSSSKKMAFAAVAASGLYTVHENLLDSGTSVREFTTPAGVVFAVAWRGPVLPDLSELLGNYFAAFKLQIDQARVAGGRGAPVSIQSADLVVQSNGRMRRFFGHAYAPTLIPTGVDINDLLR